MDDFKTYLFSKYRGQISAFGQMEAVKHYFKDLSITFFFKNFCNNKKTTLRLLLFVRNFFTEISVKEVGGGTLRCPSNFHFFWVCQSDFWNPCAPPETCSNKNRFRILQTNPQNTQKWLVFFYLKKKQIFSCKVIATHTDKICKEVFDVFPKIVVICKFPGTVNNSQAAEFRRWRPIFQNNRPNIDKPVKFTCRGFLLIILSFLLFFFFFSTLNLLGFLKIFTFFHFQSRFVWD